MFTLVQLFTVATLYQMYERPRSCEGQTSSFVGRASGPAIGGYDVTGAPQDRALPSHFVDGSVSYGESIPKATVQGFLSMLSRNEESRGTTDTKSSTDSSLPPSNPNIPRFVDEKFGPNPVANIPGVEDLYEELAVFSTQLLSSWTPSFEEALGRQHRASTEELGIAVQDQLNDTWSIPFRISFLNELAKEASEQEEKMTNVRVAIVTTTSVDIWGLRRELLPWMQYHTELGVSRYYILYDGNDPQVVEALQAVNHVELIHIHQPWADSIQTAKYEAYSNTTRQWSNGLGNYQLMFKQGYGEQEALHRAALDGRIDWLLHLDPDELFYPGDQGTSIPTILARQPSHVPAVRFMNYEAQPEAGDVVNRYEQITLFRVHKHFITPEAFFYRGKFILGGNKAFLYLYANGKSAVRVNAPGVVQSGPHYFSGEASERWVHSPGNPSGKWMNAVSDTSIILHYAYSYKSDVKSKARRSCPEHTLSSSSSSSSSSPTVTATATAAVTEQERNEIKLKCFVIDFDADAYIAASQGNESAIEDFFYSRMVLSEGSPLRCLHPSNGEGWCSLSNVPRFTFLMEKVGLMKRFLMPRVLLSQHERAIQRMLVEKT